MRNTRLLLLGLIAGLSIGALTALRVAHPPPQIAVDTTHHEFGELAGEASELYMFRLRNVGGRPLEILSAQSSCACTTASISKALLSPGEVAELRVGMVADWRATGKLSGRVVVRSNDPECPELVLTVAARSSPPELRLSPPTVDFGSVAFGLPADPLELTLLCRDPKSVRVSVADEVFPSPVHARIVDTGEWPRLLVWLADDVPAGPLTASVRISTRSGSATPLDLHVPLGRLQPGSTEQHLKFLMKGNLFYSRAETLDPQTGESSVVETAFDGDHYQRGQGALLSTRSSPRTRSGEYGMQPIVVPFGFAFREGDPFEYSTLLNEELWRDLEPLTTFLRSEPVGERMCDVVLVKQLKRGIEYRFTVFLDRALDQYPIKVLTDVVAAADSPAAGVSSVVTVDPIEHNSPSGPTVVPISIRTEEFDKQKQLVRSIELDIDPATLRVNEPIDDARFTIPEAQTEVVLDEDTGTRRTPGRQAADDWQFWSFRGVLWLVVALAVTALAVVLLMRRRAG